NQRVSSPRTLALASPEMTGWSWAGAVLMSAGAASALTAAAPSKSIRGSSAIRIDAARKALVSPAIPSPALARYFILLAQIYRKASGSNAADFTMGADRRHAWARLWRPCLRGDRPGGAA